jgi:hypothetical protein
MIGRTRQAALAACLIWIAAGCGGGKGSVAGASAPLAPAPKTGGLPWRAPAATDAMRLATKSGVPVDRHEYGIPGHPGTHIHAHLDVFVNGKPVQVPAGIGIDFTVPGVQHGSSPDGTPSYGGIELCARACIAALHTHDDSGVMHIESQEPRSYRLGDLFAEWHVRMDGECVGGYCKPNASIAVYRNGDRFSGNPAGLVLADREEIAVVIGSPPDVIPSTYF